MKEVLKMIYCVQLSINAWSGMRKIGREDLDSLGVQLPPEKLISLGCKRIIDPNLLLGFRALRQRAERYMDSIGTRFCGGWAIPRSRAEQVVDNLRNLKAEYDSAVSQFLARFDDSVKEWLRSFPEWEEILVRGLPSPAEIRSKFRFAWQLYEINVPDVENEGLREEIASMPDRLYDEIAKWADGVWRDSFLNKTEISRKALRPIVRMADKLRGLSFIDPRATKIVELIEKTLSGLPQRGKITGADLNSLYQVLFILSSPERMQTYGDSQENVDDGGFGIFQQCAPLMVDDDDDDDAPPSDPEPPGKTEEPPILGGFGQWF